MVARKTLGRCNDRGFSSNARVYVQCPVEERNDEDKETRYGGGYARGRDSNERNEVNADG